jgi:hypothetical protein
MPRERAQDPRLGQEREAIMRIRTLPVVAIGIAITSVAFGAGEPITTGSLVHEMIDLHRLAEFPDPGYRTIQFSSYDRRSSLPGGPEWYANSDGFGGEPIPGFEQVLDPPDTDGIGTYLIGAVDGPGAIVRCWTAAINGTIQLYLDGAETPVYDGSADDFLRRPYNIFANQAGVDPAIFDGSFNQQNAAYCPIPFARSCRIVWIGDLKKVHFYEVQVREYERGAEIVTFTPQDLERYRPEIERTASTLRRPSSHLRRTRGGEYVHDLEVNIPPGESGTLADLSDGPGMLEMLSVRVDAADITSALRQCVLRVTCDEFAEAQVESPLGDFFGAAPGINPFDAVPFTVTADGTMECRFVMPFERSMRITVENVSAQPVTVTSSMNRLPYQWDDDRSMHFRARWRVDHEITADREAPRDIPFLTACGAGRHVGTAIFLLNPTEIPTPYGGWWGEGDEKIFIDDDVRPSTFGTGSEDYFDYAWSIPDIFGWAYCGQPRNDGPGNRGFVTNHRWHIIDDLPFRSRIAFFMELWPHRRTPGFSYARIAYHYARPGVVDDHPPISADDLRELELPAHWKPVADWGARGSTFHEAERVLMARDGSHRVEAPTGRLYSHNQMLLWKPKTTGETMRFRVPIAEAGTYSVDLCAVKDDLGGRIRFWLDERGSDEAVTEANLASPGRSILRRVSSAPIDLEAGEHVLHVEFAGEPGRTVGIDFIWVQKR